MMQLPKFDYRPTREIVATVKIMAGARKAMKLAIPNISRLVVFSLSIGLTVLGLAVIPAFVKAQDKDVPASFKVPDGYMQAPMSKFRGVMMLDPKKPAGMFVTYPDDNEKTEVLRQRILAFVAPMFIHEDKGKAGTPISWDTKPLPSHEGDGVGNATESLYAGASEEMQVAIFERTSGPRPLFYGYFAMRHKPSKGDDPKFLDSLGQGVKAFDKLWKSF